MSEETKEDEGEQSHVPGGAPWSEAPGLVARGFCMGTADVVPGVSGGTMALILGIYERLVHAIRSIDLTALKAVLDGRYAEARDHVHWRFLGAVVLGQFLGVVLCTKIIKLPQLLHEHPEPVYGLFFGLVLGSIVMLARDLLADGVDGKLLLAGLVGVGLGLLVVTAVRADTPEAVWFVFLCGCVSICAMILPGISGSFVLLILHKYAYVLGAVGEVIAPQAGGGRLIPFVHVVLPFAIGCLIGLLSFARLLGWLLKRARRATLALMTGLMAGSLYAIWPFQQRTYELMRGKQKLVSSDPVWPAADGTLALTVGLAVVGLVLVVALERLAGRLIAPSKT